MTGRRSIVALAALLCAACGPEARSPREAVQAYFASLREDPVRSLVLLEPELVSRAGFRITAGPLEGTEDPKLTRIRAELAWLALVKMRQYRELAAGLAVEVVPLSAVGPGGEAEVTARVAFLGAPPFFQRFTLVRERGLLGWRIRSIEQTGVAATAKLGAFVAAPTEAARRELRSLGGFSDSAR